MFAKRRVWLALLCVTLCAVFGLAAHVAAENVSVTIGVGDTVLEVTGKTSPHAFVTIKSDDSVIGTTTASADGDYAKTFSAQDPGPHKLSLSARTPAGFTTDTVTLHLSIIEHATTTAEIFLPTTVMVEDTGLDYGQSLELKGETIPFSIVKLFLDTMESTTTESNANGEWKMSIDPHPFTEGQHQFFLRTINELGVQSYPTVSRSFTYSAVVLPEETVVSPGSSGGLALGPPVITFPASGATWDRLDITVRGTASRNAQVEVWDGTRLLGSAWSDDKGDWSIDLLLESREYNLRARACVDGQCSDFSSMIPFTHYSIQESLYVRAPKTSFIVTNGESLTLQAEVIHGKQPYKTSMQWGDETRDQIDSTSDALNFSHIYSKPGRYTPVLEIEDSQGQRGKIQFSVLVQSAPSWSPVPLFITISVVITFIAAIPVGAGLLQSYRQKK